MAINYTPKHGQIYMCDFSDFKEPEMVKIRPVIVISAKLKFRSEIVTIIPISTTPPREELPYCHKLSINYMPNQKDDTDCWAKCDMIMNVGKHRLSGIKVGRRKYIYPNISDEDLNCVKKAVLHGLGMGHLVDYY